MGGYAELGGDGGRVIGGHTSNDLFPPDKGGRRHRHGVWLRPDLMTERPRPALPVALEILPSYLPIYMEGGVSRDLVGFNNGRDP